ncbi:MAG: hypothetical protein PHR65_02590 [Syntrophomonadaceae bacterium]|nr:hypothetical protein [Syntrophomonadaceae bacterium]
MKAEELYEKIREIKEPILSSKVLDSKEFYDFIVETAKQRSFEEFDHVIYITIMGIPDFFGSTGMPEEEFYDLMFEEISNSSST